MIHPPNEAILSLKKSKKTLKCQIDKFGKKKISLLNSAKKWFQFDMLHDTLPKLGHFVLKKTPKRL